MCNIVLKNLGTMLHPQNCESNHHYPLTKAVHIPIPWMEPPQVPRHFRSTLFRINIFQSPGSFSHQKQGNQHVSSAIINTEPNAQLSHPRPPLWHVADFVNTCQGSYNRSAVEHPPSPVIFKPLQHLPNPVIPPPSSQPIPGTAPPLPPDVDRIEHAAVRGQLELLLDHPALDFTYRHCSHTWSWWR